MNSSLDHAEGERVDRAWLKEAVKAVRDLRASLSRAPIRTRLPERLQLSLRPPVTELERVLLSGLVCEAVLHHRAGVKPRITTAAQPGGRQVHVDLPSERLTAEDGFVTQALGIIEQRARERLFRLSDLAAALGVRESALSQKLARVTGKGFPAHVHDVRTERALSVLETTDHPVAEVARQCGYANARDLDRYFTARFGLSPSAFRRCLRTGAE
jgi:AraC-like DNA-binding protein